MSRSEEMAAFSSLTSREREIVFLTAYHGWSLVRSSALVYIGVKTMKSHLVRIYAKVSKEEARGSRTRLVAQAWRSGWMDEVLATGEFEHLKEAIS